MPFSSPHSKEEKNMDGSRQPYLDTVFLLVAAVAKT
jgi:hypothetical protein